MCKVVDMEWILVKDVDFLSSNLSSAPYLVV